jgi:hypothetical protein
MQITRRKLAAAVLAPAAVALPQTPQTDELAAARQRMKDNAAAMAKIDIPDTTEPAFQFKV